MGAHAGSSRRWFPANAHVPAPSAMATITTLWGALTMENMLSTSDLSPLVGPLPLGHRNSPPTYATAGSKGKAPRIAGVGGYYRCWTGRSLAFSDLDCVRILHPSGR